MEESFSFTVVKPMTDGPMTATEVQARMDEWSKHTPAPNFSSAIYALARRLQRAALLNAIQGSPEDRFAYCVSRAAAKATTDLACYGTAVYDPNKLSELGVRWFLRLERLANRGTPM